MGQTYLSTVGQPGARSDNVTPVQGQEGSVVGAYLLQIHVFGALKERCVCSETDRNRYSLFLAQQLATGTSLLLSHSQSRKSQSAGPGHMLCRLLPGYCCHSFPSRTECGASSVWDDAEFRK